MLSDAENDRLASLMRTQFRRHKKGQSSSHRPEDEAKWKLDPLDWAWFNTTREEELQTRALDVAKQIFDWMDAHEGRNPYRTSKDKTEAMLGEKIGLYRQNKRTRDNSWATYEEKFMAYAKERGYPDLFEVQDITKDALIKANKLFDWMDAHEGRNPSKDNPEDATEKHLGIGLSMFKAGKKQNRIGWRTYGAQLEDLTNSRGYLGAFDEPDRDGEALAKANEIFDWMDKHGRKPLANAKDDTERFFGSILSAHRGNKKAKRGPWAKGARYGRKLERLAAARGFPRIYETRDQSANALAKANEIFDWIDKHGKLPRGTGTEEEKVLARKLGSFRKDKVALKYGWLEYGEAVIALGKQRGHAEIFDPRDLVGSALAKAKELFDWMDEHGRIPLASASGIERTLSIRGSSFRKNKRDNAFGWPLYGDEVTAMAKERGHLDFIEAKSLTQKAIVRVVAICDWTDEHGRPPRTSHSPSVTEAEAKAGKYLSRFRTNRRQGSQGWPIYGSDILAFLKERGHAGMFE